MSWTDFHIYPGYLALIAYAVALGAIVYFIVNR
jgi:hypothetical protein